MSLSTLIIFAKAPISGLAKTRLIPALGATGAAKLHGKLTSETLQMAQSPMFKVELWCTPDTKHPFFIKCRKEFAITLHRQPNGNLGKRMAHALKRALRQNSHAAIIGTDCPALDQEMLQRTFRLLRNGFDAVIIPAIDGGYVLLGLKRFSSKLFSNIEWSTENVIHETRSRLRELKWRWYELPHQRDLDSPDDLLLSPYGQNHKLIEQSSDKVI